MRKVTLSVSDPILRAMFGDISQRTHVGSHVLLAPVIASPVLAREPNLFRQLVVRAVAFRRAVEERQDVVKIRIVDLRNVR